MVPGLWGAPCKAVSAFAPPMSTQDFNLDPVKIEAKFTDYDAGKMCIRDSFKMSCGSCKPLNTVLP